MKRVYLVTIHWVQRSITYHTVVATNASQAVMTAVSDNCLDEHEMYSAKKSCAVSSNTVLFSIK